jgi:hypothetical protein
MTVRLIVREDDAGMAANVGGSVLTTYTTFDIDLPDLERYLRNTGSFYHVQLVGAELLPDESTTTNSQSEKG